MPLTPTEATKLREVVLALVDANTEISAALGDDTPISFRQRQAVAARSAEFEALLDELEGEPGTGVDCFTSMETVETTQPEPALERVVGETVKMMATMTEVVIVLQRQNETLLALLGKRE